MGNARDRIVQAALTLIRDVGLSAVTMVEVARTAGVARATLYNHYSDVPSILADATGRHNDQAITGLRQALAVAGSPVDTIEHLVRYVAGISTHGHTLETHQGLPPELRDQLSGFTDEIEARLTRSLSDGVTAGEFRPDLDVDTTARLLRHLLNGLSELVAASPAEAPRLVDEVTKTIMAAVAPLQRP